MADQINSLEELKDVVATEEAPAEAAPETPVVETPVVLHEPQRDDLGRSYATGKRKDAVARLSLIHI